MRPSGIMLDYITTPDLAPVEVVTLAAANGYDGISLWVNAPVDTLPIPCMRAGSPELREVRKALEDCGLIVSGVECFDLGSSTARDDNRRALDAAGELGALTATAVCFAPLSTQELTDRLGILAEDASANNLSMTIEFMAPAIAGELNSLSRALQIIALTARDNIGVTMDMLHLTRTGASIAEIAAVPPERIGYIQLCDGPAQMPVEDQLAEAGWGRLYPGEGNFRLHEMLAVLPGGKPVGIEIPREDRKSADIARDAMAMARTFLEI